MANENSRIFEVKRPTKRKCVRCKSKIDLFNDSFGTRLIDYSLSFNSRAKLSRVFYCASCMIMGRFP